MEYMFLIHSDETFEMPAPDTAEFTAMMAQWAAYNQTLTDGGHFVSGANLVPSTATTQVVKAFGQQPSVVDGPFIESKEQMGGYYLVRADDLDQALELAKAIPIPQATIEVRPVAYRPDAG
jgi:hypothetical protein